MDRSLLLRIDFTRAGHPLGLPPAARGVVELRSICFSSAIADEICAIQPDILCFDYDCPDAAGLGRLRQIKQEFPSLPILMLTEHNSEDLAVWALRARVWDYFVKPLDVAAFLRAVEQLNTLRSRGRNGDARDIIIPASSATRNREGSEPSTNSAERAVAKAKAYVNQNFAEKISAREVADLCNMSSFHFSRSFKRICGVTFSEYLLEVRIRKAIKLLSRTKATVTGACYEVGFRDPSYFSRIFRRYAGITPSQYRDRWLQRAVNKAGDTEAQAQSESELDESTSDLHAELLLQLKRR